MIILGIETSCDETAVSVVEAEGDLNDLHFNVLGSAVNSQIDIHKQYGGVFPTLAKREHQKNLLPVLIEALSKAGLISNFQFPISNEFSINQFFNEVQKPQIDLIAVTVGPGLEPALWVGIEFAKKLGEKWQIPIIPANHMLGHIASVLFSESSKLHALSFPALALLISGGHTELVLMKNWAEKEKIGSTKDDAVGEAFDKVARMLGLPYPGGPEISRLATQARNFQFSIFNFQLPKFPRPMIHSKDFNFSFSGLKTAVLYYIKKKSGGAELPSLKLREGFGGEISPEQKMAIAREFEDAVIETLLYKTKKAIDQYGPKTLVIGGGVIANKALRENFLKLKENYPDLEILIPERALTTDNATMIAASGFIEYLNNGAPERELRAQGNLNIEV